MTSWLYSVVMCYTFVLGVLTAHCAGYKTMKDLIYQGTAQRLSKRRIQHLATLT